MCFIEQFELKTNSMKNVLLLTAVIIFSTLHVSAQSKKNDLKLTVSALPLFGSADGFESDLNGIVIKPSLGYFKPNSE